MRELELDPIPASRLDSLHATFPRIAATIEECLDWVEADPVDLRAKRRRFTNGMWAIVRPVAGSEWVILWEESEPGHPVVRFIGEAASL
ncbi:MAG: hypothetical protein M3N98_08530 [Actinomycetota bacterium]|nr:hypothetical protein [Actinomycetota bacterium]